MSQQGARFEDQFTEATELMLRGFEGQLMLSVLSMPTGNMREQLRKLGKERLERYRQKFLGSTIESSTD